MGKFSGSYPAQRRKAPWVRFQAGGTEKIPGQPRLHLSKFLDRCQAVIESLPKIASELFYIRSEREGFIKITPNRVQQHYHNDRVLRGYASHDEVLKARKHGFSTWKELEGLALTLFVDGFSGLIMGDEREKTQKLFNIALWAYQRLPDDVKAARKLDTDRRDGISIGGSTLYITTAGSKDPARSDTLHWAHLTEVAFYPDPEKIMAGVTEALADAGKAAHLCRESTPKGRNWWYDVCAAARDGVSPSKMYFYPWWWSDKYALNLRPDEIILPTEEEKAIIAVAAQQGFKLTPEQLKWRRFKRLPTELGARTEEEEEAFFEEYVEDFETCFLIGGRPVFKPQVLRILGLQASATWPLERKHYPGGELVVWREAGKFPTIMAVDVAEGKLGGDWSVLSIWETAPERMTNIARLKIKCSPTDLASHITNLAPRFHYPLVAIESNAAGSLVIDRVQQSGYANLYHQVDRDGMETEHVGWVTNVRTKRQMITRYRELVNSGEAVIYDPELIEQMGNVQLDDLGQFVTPKNRHDDIFIAAAIASMAREQAELMSGGGVKVASYA